MNANFNKEFVNNSPSLRNLRSRRIYTSASNITSNLTTTSSTSLITTSTTVPVSTEVISTSFQTNNFFNVESENEICVTKKTKNKNQK